jgi:hypothetical protein
MNNTGDIIDNARVLLNDPYSGVWEDSELLVYGNECLDDIINSSKYLEDYRDYALTSGTAMYDRDTEAVSIERVEYNGKVIPSIEVHELSDWNANWAYETGEIRKWFAFGSGHICYSLIPSWTADLSTFDVEYGLIISAAYTGVTITFDSEYGILIDCDTDTTDVIYFVDDPAYGEVVIVDEDVDAINHRIVVKPATMVNDADVPDMPSWFYRMIVFYICWRALNRDSPARDEKLAKFYEGMWKDCLTTFKIFYKKGHKPKAQFSGMKPMTRTSKERYYIGGRYNG